MIKKTILFKILSDCIYYTMKESISNKSKKIKKEMERSKVSCLIALFLQFCFYGSSKKFCFCKRKFSG